MRTRIVRDSPTGAARGADTVIVTDGLSKQFGDFHALTDMTLTVPRNSIVGFLGPNGAGKTTAIKLLLGLSRPTAGQATIFGLDSVQDSLAIRRRIGFLGQDPRFYPHLTAYETLEFAARFFYQGPPDAIRARIDETLALVGLEDKRDVAVDGFSGGERQRLGIAQAQINHPELLILDEPAAALDPVGRRDALEVMQRLRAHTTIFYSTHILDDVERMSDRVAILDRGRLIADAPTATLLDDGRLTYEITVRGDGAAARAALASHPWVADITATANSDTTTLAVQVTDQDAAEAGLLPAVVAANVVTTRFVRRQQRLEDTFLQLVEATN